jgi:hypothetical protein
MEKKLAWIMLGILALIQGILLYSGFNGAVESIIIPLVAYFFGIVTKTGVDKLVNNKK